MATTAQQQRSSTSSPVRSTGSTDEPLINILVKQMGGKSIRLQVSPSETVKNLKVRVATESGIPAADQKLSWKGKKLEDGSAISSYNMRKRATLLLMRSRTASSVNPEDAVNDPDDVLVPPKPCLDTSCSFFGRSDTEGYCSQCYQKIQDAKKEAEEKLRLEKLAKEEEERAAIEASRPKQADITRCFKCRKYVGITIIQCRCGYYFCAKHRYADMHDCSFDYKHIGKDQLRKANKEIRADKVRDRLQ